MARNKLWRADVPICATVYVKAATAESARKKIKALNNLSPALQDGEGSVPVSGLRYDDPRLPAISLSPCMTIGEIDPITRVERADE